MQKHSLTVATTVLRLAFVLLPTACVQAAELQVLAGGAMTTAMRELGAQFENATGHKLVMRFGTTPVLITLVTTGGPFDVGVVPREVFKDGAAQARFVPGRQSISLAWAWGSPSARALPNRR